MVEFAPGLLLELIVRYEVATCPAAMGRRLEAA
jgi:hypothetical protein